MRAALAGALLALAPVAASAHPVDEIVQGAYLTLAPGEVRLELDLTPGTEVVATVLEALDVNSDETISDAEARTYAQLVLAQSTLKVDGTPLSWTLDRVIMPPRATLALGDVIKIYAIARTPEKAGERLLVYDNRYAPAKTQRVANIFLQQAGGWQYQVTGQERSDDGQRLTVTYRVSRP